MRRTLRQAASAPFQAVIWACAFDTIAEASGMRPFDTVYWIPAWFGSLGLWDARGVPKPSAGVWQSNYGRITRGEEKARVRG